MIKFGPNTRTMRYTITLTHSHNRSRSQSERIMNIEPAFDPFHIESPICSSTWSCAAACSFLRWWWILMGAYFHEHIFSWFVKMISALTLTHHYSSLKLLFVPPWKKKLGLNQLIAKDYGSWLLRSWRCAARRVFSFHLATSLRSQGLRLINTRCGQKCGAAEGGEMPPVFSETQHCHPVSHIFDVWLTGSLLALSMYSLPGKGANKIFCRSAQPRDFVFHQETPLSS